MSRTKHAVELCALLVDETYGELTSRIFTILLRRGRLPIPLLAQHTRLSPRQLRHGLAVLLQQNLIYYNTDEDTGATHYEANAEAAYALVRSGKIMEAVESRYGSFAKDVVQNLLLLGHTRVGDLEDAYAAKQKSKPNGKTNGNLTNGVNGKTEHQSHTSHNTGVMHTVVAQLLRVGVIEPVKEHMFLSPSDTYNKNEKEILKMEFQGSTKGIKQKEELKNLVHERLRSLRSDNQVAGLKQDMKSMNGHTNGVNGSNKRRRLSNGAGDEERELVDDGTRLDPNLVIRINHEKCIVILRNQRLVALANERIGETTSQIFEYALRLVEGKIERCRLDPNIDDVDPDNLPVGPSFTTRELAKVLPAYIDAGFGVGKPDAEDKMHQKEPGNEHEHADNHVNGNANGKHTDEDVDMDDPFDEEPRPAKRQKVTFEKQLPKPTKPHSDSLGDFDDRVTHISNHLKLLEKDKCKFVSKSGVNSYGEWTVNFDQMVSEVRNVEIDAMILSNFGKSGHRLARVLRKMGKLDEKQLPNVALMKQKDARTKLAEMQMAGIVDIQEVPRDANRTVNRTIFLWYFDEDRVAVLFLEKLFKAMSRVFQRLDVERRKYADVLAITERSDVRDLPPADYLDQGQLKQLLEWKAKEDKLLNQVQKLDELVGIFRDY